MCRFKHEGFSALHHASMNEELGMMRALLESDISGMSVNAKSGMGYTPLMYTAMEGKPKAAKLLMNYGALVDVVDDNDQTAAELSVDSDCTAIFKKYKPPGPIARGKPTGRSGSGGSVVRGRQAGRSVSPSRSGRSVSASPARGSARQRAGTTVVTVDSVSAHGSMNSTTVAFDSGTGTVSTQPTKLKPGMRATEYSSTLMSHATCRNVFCYFCNTGAVVAGVTKLDQNTATACIFVAVTAGNLQGLPLQLCLESFLRTKVNAELGIKEDKISSCTAVLCVWCSAAQTKFEMEARGRM